MMTAYDWRALSARCAEAKGADKHINADLYEACGYRLKPEYRLAQSPAFTDSLDAIVSLIEKTLPGWWWSCGSCHLTGDGDIGDMNPARLKTHATLAPDYNDPLATGLPDIFERPEFDEGFSTSLDGRGREFACLALCASFCAAMSARAEIAEREGK